MSSDAMLAHAPVLGPEVLEAPPPGPGPERSFRVLVTTVLVVLALLAAGLTAANALRGPRVVRADVDPARASAVAGQHWTLDLDQTTVADGVEVALEPEVPVTTSVTDRRVDVRFERPLDLATTYTLRATLPGTGSHGVSHVVERLTTPTGEVFLLQRAGRADDAGTDRVLRTDVATGRQEAVFHAPGVQEVASAAPYLAVVRGDGANGRGALETVRLGPGSSGAAVPVASGSVLQQLRSSGAGGLFGYVSVAVGTDDPPQLHALDPATGRTGLVLGSDGQPIQAVDWRFVPGTSQMVVQTPDLLVWLVDPWNRTPVRPLGGHSYLVDFVPGTRQLLVEDRTRTVLDLATGQQHELTSPLAPAGQVVYQSWTLATPERTPVLLSGVDASGVTTSDLTLEVGDGGMGGRPVWEVPTGSTVVRTCLSPNGQLLELDVAPPGAAPDGYPIVPGSVGTTAVLVDLGSGQVSGPFPGAASTWCH